MSEQLPYTCKNFRPNRDSLQMPGACPPHQGQVIADLYYPNGTFYRSAVVADVGRQQGLAGAQAFCDRQTSSATAEEPKS